MSHSCPNPVSTSFLYNPYIPFLMCLNFFLLVYMYKYIQREISVSKHFRHIPVECTNEAFCWIHFHSVQEVLIFRQPKFHRTKLCWLDKIVVYQYVYVFHCVK